MSANYHDLHTIESKMKVDQIGVYLGAEISGVTLRNGLSDADVAAIEMTLAEHSVVVFRNQPMSGEELMALGRKFGALSIHPFTDNDGANPELIKFNNDEKTPPSGTDIWHSDETFREIPPMGTMLLALDVQKLGGDTLFVSMTAAWEGLSDRMQHFLSGLEAYHDFLPFKKYFGDSREEREKLKQFELNYPPALHPVVTEHPVTKKKAVFVNRQFTTHIKGMDEVESATLLAQLFDLAKMPEYQYRHHWENDTLVFWDNRSTNHYAVHDYYPKRRYMRRVTISGTERPRPAFPPADRETVRNRKSRAG